MILFVTLLASAAWRQIRKEFVGKEAAGAAEATENSLSKTCKPWMSKLCTQYDDVSSVNKVAEVVRDLWRRDQERGLSAGEKRMLAKARQILVGELALAENTDDAKAMTILDEALATAS